MDTNLEIINKKMLIEELTSDLIPENALHSLIKKYHYQTVENIIEENTSEYSVFHYIQTKLINKINGTSYWWVKQIGSKKSSVVNSNKEFIIPFNYYNSIECANDNKHIVCTQNDNKLVFDYSGNLIEGNFCNNVYQDIQEKNRKIALLIEEIKNLHSCNNQYLDRLLEKIKFFEENFQVVKQNTQLMENTQIKHSIFDYCKSKFFTNGHNKRYFTLQEKDSEKFGLINAKGELIAPFIYDDLGDFVFGEGDFIHMGIGNKFGLLDCLGNVVIEPISDNIISFFDGCAVLERNKKFGYIDTTGNIIIPAIYDYASYFLFGKAEVKLNGESFYINRKGERLEEC